MSIVPDEQAATREPPGGPSAPADTGWLILQRLGDLKEGQARLEARMDRLETKVEAQIGNIQTQIGALEAKVETQIGDLRREFDAKLTRTSNSQLLVGILGFLGVIATLVTVLIKIK